MKYRITISQVEEDGRTSSQVSMLTHEVEARPILAGFCNLMRGMGWHDDSVREALEDLNEQKGVYS